MLHLAKINVPLFLKEKRNNKKIRSERRIARKLKVSIRTGSIAERNAFGDKSLILGLLSKDVALKSQNKKGRVKFKAPEKFSIFENPTEVLKSISMLATEIQQPRVRDIHLDMSLMQSYDLAANGLLDVIVEEFTTKAKQTGRRIKWSGKYPTTNALRRFVQALGVIKRLKIFHEYPNPEVASKLETFEHRCKHYVRAVRLNDTDEKSRITQRFVAHVNACLERIAKTLTSDAKNVLAKYIGEVIDNAEEHSGMYDWTIQGYLDTQSDDWICEICIFNFGKTIAATLDGLPLESFARQYVQPYLDAHEKQGLFSTGWHRDRLLTIIALQLGVSSKKLDDGVNTRGFGTHDLISFFMKVQKECSENGRFDGAVMNLISGNTLIKFDGKYQMRDGKIAFNHTNDLHSLPDSNYVSELKGVSFPGTILSIKYPLTIKHTAAAS